ncbi:hypothetical protein C882_3831 [Caenispirillum salinarum AK4]|uniref:histidine kinase n=1 Tax=Caenispirillum salinarum AK4 TaxID=1238182 RepID=K9HM83_9PROT|nr:ATP-binding protein [Caenispirillum salinarum]EKV31458.1 hypothetical protein C882_3831 [Caenispirillum salinarum AK4]
MPAATDSAARSRRVTLAAVLGAVSLCALGLSAGTWVLLQERTATLRLAQIDAMHLARQVASDAATLALLGDKAAVDANRVAYRNPHQPARIDFDLDSQAALLPGMHSGAVFGARGQRIAASVRFPEISRSWRQQVLERHRDGWEDMIISSAPETGVPGTIAVSRARWNDARSFEGYAVSLVDLSRLGEWAAEQARMSGATVMLMLSDGTVLAPLAKGGPAPVDNPAVLRRRLDAALKSVRNGKETDPDTALETAGVVVGVGLARDFPLIGLVEMARDGILADWSRRRDIAAAGGVVMVLAVALALALFVRGERRRARAEEGLRLSEERLGAALENGNLSLWDWDVATNSVVFGPRLPAMLGYGPGELDLSVEGFQALMHPDDKPRAMAALMAHVETPDNGVFAAEHRLRRKDGGWTWIADRGRAVEVDAQGRAVRVIGVHADITRRKQAETALHEKSRALEDSNRDLEQFAYIASHDLQEPLRMVSSYLSLLLRREGDRLSDKGRGYADTAADGAKRMGQLIRDLLEYSRVGTRGEEPAPQDTAAVLAEAVENLGIAVAESGATITVAPDAPPVLGDRSQLVRLVQNLVGNALKYRAPDREPVISVGWRLQEDEDAAGGMVILSVADNGIGIDPADFDRLFQIFQRLHARDEYEGTGIGLAVCRRIVERHGGRLWVDSAPGEGSTFHAALPRAAEAPAPDVAAETPVRALAS